MADLNYTVSAGELSLTASTAKTAVAVVAGTAQRVKIKGIEIFGKGTTNGDTPVKVELITAATITVGTGGTVVTSVTDTEMSESPRATITGAYTAEPTYGTPVITRIWEVHPQTGLAVYFPLHDEIKLKAGTGFAIRLTSSQNETMAVNILCEE